MEYGAVGVIVEEVSQPVVDMVRKVELCEFVNDVQYRPTLQCALYKVVQIALVLQYRGPIPAHTRTYFANVEKYRIPTPISRYFEIPIPSTEPTLKNTEKLLPTSNADTDS